MPFLVLTRREGESLLIGDIRVIVMWFKGKEVRLGIEAPAHVRVTREEGQVDASKRNPDCGKRGP